MIIEDDELRELYKASSSEHLQKLESELMLLEKNPQDTNAIEEFLREAHTLKGDSRMLGLSEIEMLMHQLEDCVEGIKTGKGEITPELCDRLYRGIDAVNQLSRQAITGEKVEVNTFEILALLMGAESSSPSELNTLGDDDDLFADRSSSDSDLFDDSDGEDDLFADTVDLIDDTAAETPEIQAIQTAASVRDYHIDTIRVEPKKLDTLMTQASELTVTKLRISQQVNEIEQMATLWEEWNKDSSLNSSLIKQIENNLPPEKFHLLQYFFYSTQQRLESLGSLVGNLKTRANEDITSLGIISDRLESGIQELRQLPLSTVFNLFPRMVRDLARQQGKEINFIIEGGDTKTDKRILEEIKDPLLHLLRNAIDHGIETPAERASLGKPTTATILLRGYQSGNSIGIEISDDGRGLSLDSIKSTALKRKIHTEAELASMSEAQIHSLIFASGFSTRTEVTELSGRGVGLDVVRANVERLKGSIQVTSEPGNGCKFQVRLNTSLATTQVVIVAIDNTLYAIPLEFIQTMLTISSQDIFAIEDSQTIMFADRPTSISWLADLLQLPRSKNKLTSNNQNLACIILQIGSDRFGVIVDALIDRQDVVLKPQSKLLKRIPNIAGATILGSGEVCMILNPTDLLHSLRKGSWQDVAHLVDRIETKNKLLLVEDSVLIRTQMQRLLKGAGYDVSVAVDGLEGWNKIQEEHFDVVVSDVEMPNLNGLELTTKIRQNNQYADLPIILVTTLASPEDKRRGAEAGANAYLTKGDFDQKLLLNTINQLIS